MVFEDLLLLVDPHRFVYMDPRMLIWIQDTRLQTEPCQFHFIKGDLINPFDLVLKVTWEKKCQFVGSHQLQMTFCQRFL